MKGKEWVLAIVAFSAAVVMAVVAYLCTDYWRALLVNLATTFIGLAIALLVINVYLDLNTRKQAMRPLLSLVTPSIQTQHNAVLDKAWARFGKPQFEELLSRYNNNNGDPRALSPNERDTLYTMIKEEKQDIFDRMTKLEGELKELALILGWSFRPGILSASFRCRHSMIRLKAITFDDSEQSKLAACEHFLDMDIAGWSVFHQLIEFLGIKKEDAYDV